jgi:hypothetical protein
MTPVLEVPLQQELQDEGAIQYVKPSSNRKRNARRTVSAAVRACGVRGVSRAGVGNKKTDQSTMVFPTSGGTKTVRRLLQCDSEWETGPFGIPQRREGVFPGCAVHSTNGISDAAMPKKQGRRFKPVIVKLPEGADPIDPPEQLREYCPTRERFVIVNEYAVEIKRFILLEDALTALRNMDTQRGMHAVLAIYSGCVCGFQTKPGKKFLFKKEKKIASCR